MSNRKLNREDQELLESFEAGEFESDLNDERRAQLAKAAADTFKKEFTSREEHPRRPVLR